jgi:hypothetical protein
MAGRVSSDTGLAHRWLRQRALFAEQRALERNEKPGERGSGGGEPRRTDNAAEKGATTENAGRDKNGRDKTSWSQIGQVEISRVEVGNSKIGRGEPLSLRLKPTQATLLSEEVACSCYRSRSAYLRATATGRDRRAPILGKAGMLFFWTWAYLGEEICLGKENSQNEGSVGRREALENLSDFLFGLGQVGEALTLIQRHLRAAQLSAEDSLEKEEGEQSTNEKLLPVPETVQRRLDSSPKLTVSVRVCRERERLIAENVRYSAYDDKSTYARHMAFGWDRNARVLAQCATIAEWMARHWTEVSGGRLGPEEWRRLDEAMQRRFGIFLFGPGVSGERDVEGALREGTRHLLGADPKTVAAWMPVEL